MLQEKVLTILLIDDDELFLESIREVFYLAKDREPEFKFQIYSAISSTQARDIYDRKHIDIVITDENFGENAAKGSKLAREFAGAVVFLMTGNLSREDLNANKNLYKTGSGNGIDAVFSKRKEVGFIKEALELADFIEYELNEHSQSEESIGGNVNKAVYRAKGLRETAKESALSFVYNIIFRYRMRKCFEKRDDFIAVSNYEKGIITGATGLPYEQASKEYDRLKKNSEDDIGNLSIEKVIGIFELDAKDNIAIGIGLALYAGVKNVSVDSIYEKYISAKDTEKLELRRSFSSLYEMAKE